MLIQKRLSILYKGIEQKRCIDSASLKLTKCLVWNFPRHPIFTFTQENRRIKCIVSKMVSKVIIDNLPDE